MKKTLALAVATVLGALAPAANAAYDRYGNFVSDEPRVYYWNDDTARVIESHPVYAATSYVECWSPERNAYVQRDEVRNPSTCRTVTASNDTLQGYDVTYVYRGGEYTTRLAQEPGRYLRLGMDIRYDGRPYEWG